LRIIDWSVQNGNKTSWYQASNNRAKAKSVQDMDPYAMSCLQFKGHQHELLLGGSLLPKVWLGNLLASIKA